jgi:hypothetical protein
MKRGLAISTVLLLLAATWLPLVIAQDDPEYEFDPELGDLLSTFGMGYVENLVLWSGAGVGLVWGPSYDGNQIALDDRIDELEAAAGGSMPANTVPIVVPFVRGNPVFDGPAPLDHSELWMWNSTGMEANVGLGSVAYTVTAETDLAMHLMDGGVLDAEGLLLLEAALEAVRFTNERMGFNGTDLGPINMTDPNMTDEDKSNGWWLPVTEAAGTINMTTGNWEDVTLTDGPSLEASLEFLRSLIGLSVYLDGNTDLVGDGKPFANGTDTEVWALAGAVWKNIKALYYDTGRDLFHEDSVLTTGTLTILYHTLQDFSETMAWDLVYTQGWALWEAEKYAGLLVQLIEDDGTLLAGYDTALGGFPGAFIPPYAPLTTEASNVEYAMAIDALYDASDRFGGITYNNAGQSCLIVLEDTYWYTPEGLFVEEPMAETPSIMTSTQVAGMAAYVEATEAGVDLAKYRIPELWGGIVAAGLQLSETDATGENYTMISEPDTNNNTIWKHNWDRGTGMMDGIAPVLGTGSTLNIVTGNWSSDHMVDTKVLMQAAVVWMGMDSEWFDDMGAPMYSAETAYRYVHWTDDDWYAWGEEWRLATENVTKQLEELQNQTENCSKVIDELMAEIASLEENITAMSLDLNDSLENESVLRDQNDWLRQTLEETNETVDDLEETIEILEATVERLAGDVEDKNENISRLLDELRASQNNVTLLEWELQNASAALAQAEFNLAAAENQLEDTEAELDELQGRMVMVAILKVIGRL